MNDTTQKPNAPEEKIGRPELSNSGEHALRSDKEKLAEDIAYTVNHAVSCTALDLLGGSPIGSKLSENVFEKYSEKWTGFKISPYCTHKIGWYTAAEVAGDLTSVIPTIALQKFAPGTFTAMENVLEPTFGWAFKKGAHKGAMRWAKEHDLSQDDVRVKEYETSLYKHEVEHLPHALVWSAVSLPLSGEILSLAGHDHDSCGHDHGHSHGHSHSHQEHSHGHSHAEHEHTHNHEHKKPSHWSNLRGNMMHVLAGKIFSSVILLGARSAYPDKARHWDSWASDTIYSPVTKGMGGLLGVDEATLQRARDKHDFINAPPEALKSKTLDDAPHTPTQKIQAEKNSSEVLIPQHLQR